MFLRNRLWAGFVLFVAVGFVASLAYAPPPDQGDVAKKVKAAKLDESKAGSAEKNGKKAKFTPAAAEPSEADLAKGAVIGKLSTELPASEIGLDPGDYHVYVMKEGDTWKSFAVAADGTMIEAKGTKVEKAARRHEKSELKLMEDHGGKPAMMSAEVEFYWACINTDSWWLSFCVLWWR